MTTALKSPKTIYQVWKNLPEGTHCQIINNTLVMSPSPLDVHQVVLNNINIKLSLFLRKNSMGQIRIAPYDVHFSKQNIFQPDLIFIANENLRFIEPKGLVGVPDIVIEVLSPGIANKDLKEKKSVYEKYGVKEYYIVKPDNKNVRGYILRDKVFEALNETVSSITSQLLKTKISF